MRKILAERYTSPAGELIIGGSGNRLCMCDWVNSKRITNNIDKIRSKLNAEFTYKNSEITMIAQMQLDEYFAGNRANFDLPLLFTGTAFQNMVWMELMHIPYSATITYAELAQRIGKPSGTRAVAAAVAANPMSIIVPCHRVIGSDNTLTGYAGGLRAKQILLSLEK